MAALLEPSFEVQTCQNRLLFFRLGTYKLTGKIGCFLARIDLNNTDLLVLDCGHYALTSRAIKCSAFISFTVYNAPISRYLPQRDDKNRKPYI
jgi:hypothetical protein